MRDAVALVAPAAVSHRDALHVHGVRAVLRVERALPPGVPLQPVLDDGASGPARGPRPQPVGRRRGLGRGRLTRGLTARAYAGAVTDADRYRLAFLDWLACAARGRREPPARAARAAAEGLAGRVAAAGCAGHVLDYDDTYAAGLVHASAPVAPVALLLAAERGLSLGAALDAYAAGFETTAALARASHPALYERGWHPTSVCGVAGAAVAAARLLDLEPDRERVAVGISLLRAGGLQAAFGTDGKALQVGLAAATGLEAARLSAAGAGVSADAIATGFEAAYGGTWEAPQRPARDP